MNEPTCFGRYKDISEICDACMVSYDCYQSLMKELINNHELQKTIKYQ